MAEHNIFGIIAEKKASDFLINKGYFILDTNWRCGHKEIDIIAMDGSTLVIVEVKARKTDKFGMPYLAVDAKKIKKLVSAANFYVKKHAINRDIRFDILSILQKNDGIFDIEHIQDAFLPPLNG